MNGNFSNIICPCPALTIPSPPPAPDPELPWGFPASSPSLGHFCCWLCFLDLEPLRKPPARLMLHQLCFIVVNGMAPREELGKRQLSVCLTQLCFCVLAAGFSEAQGPTPQGAQSKAHIT